MADVPEGGTHGNGPARNNWFQQMLGLFPPGRLIDLGSGHGTFARDAADAGWTVTAVDARGDRYPTDEPRVNWQVGDVRTADLTGFDLILCLGLFYHLTVDDQIDLLARCSGRPIILDTHVANDRKGGHPYRLSEPVTVRGYTGRHYLEPDQATHSHASWGNKLSFWPRTRDLYKMLADHGYDVLTGTPWYEPSRTFFLCLPVRT
jgi:SAM-dependent methyltransferase